MPKDKLVELVDFSVTFLADPPVTPVDHISLTIHQGEIIGIVGESGSGKSVMSQSILRLLENDFSVLYHGQVLLENKDLLALPLAQMHNIRGKEIAMIFQDAMSALNPLTTVGDQIKEAFLLHHQMGGQEAKEKTIALIGNVGIHHPEEYYRRYPHELSGGMQQRVMIAMAIACQPKLIIADEPTTALDFTTQKQVLHLLTAIHQEFATSILFITHDIRIVAQFAQRIFVMYLGQIVEEISSADLLVSPLHPYTKALINSLPQKTDSLLVPISGTVPSLQNIPKGCRFSTRCPYTDQQCLEEEPPLETIHQTAKVRCWHVPKK